MEFGLFSQGAVPQPLREDNPNAEHDRLMAAVETGVFAEQCGFKSVWASEHHFLDEYSHMSSPEIYLSFIAARTKKIHIGSAIMNITPKVNHPFRVAENVAMLDHLSEGRFEFGTGRGSSTTEMFGFGVEKAEDTVEMWGESIRELPRMWRETAYHYEGEWFSTPKEARIEGLVGRNVLPKPYTKPHPPMWVAAGSPGTFEKAARMGLGVICFSFGDPQRLRPMIETYKEIIRNPTDQVGEWVNNNIMAVTNLCVLEDRAEALELASTIGMSYYQSLVVRWLDSFPKPKNFPVWPEVLPEGTPEQLEYLIPGGSVIIGDPDDARTGVKVWQELGVDTLTFSPLTTQISLADTLRTMEVFGREVIPEFDLDPDHHTTTKQRIAQVGA